MGWSEALKVLRHEGLESRWDKATKMANGVRNLFLDCGFELLADEHKDLIQLRQSCIPMELTTSGGQD